ncbi:hypothetical protein KX816_18325 [Sphingosinicellaceae bacterium]|nr:hypothetical protein KX816_18325 [Sphingosinicellaceae bacterium]
MLASYAADLELSRQNLCALLVLREITRSQLGDLKKRFAGSESRARSTRVTARISSQTTKTAFSKIAKANGVGSDDAAAFVFRAELQTGWLKGALHA